jgi:hypothetical protein
MRIEKNIFKPKLFGMKDQMKFFSGFRAANRNQEELTKRKGGVMK